MRNRRLTFGLLAAALIAALCAGYAYAATLSSRVHLVVTGTLTNTLDLVTGEAPLTKTVTLTLANGTGANQADVIWSDTRTLATGANEDLDFAGGGLTDAFGAAVEPARIKMLIIHADSENTTNLTISGDANGIPIFDDPTDTATIAPDGLFVIGDPGATGYVVTAATGDILQIANAAGASADYDIVVIGASS